MSILRFQSKGVKIPYPNLLLAERCFDAYAKLGMSVSLNVQTFTLTLF